MEKIDPVAVLEKAKKKPATKTDMSRVTAAAAVANREAANERRRLEAEINGLSIEEIGERLRPDALRELAKQLKHRDPKVRAAAMKEALRLTDKQEDEQPTEIVYVTPALRDDVEAIESLLQDAEVTRALRHAAVEAVEHQEERQALPEFVPMEA